MAYVWKKIDYELKEIFPDYVPFEELTPEEQEELYDSSFDWDDDDDDE